MVIDGAPVQRRGPLEKEALELGDLELQAADAVRLTGRVPAEERGRLGNDTAANGEGQTGVEGREGRLGQAKLVRGGEAGPGLVLAPVGDARLETPGTGELPVTGQLPPPAFQTGQTHPLPLPRRGTVPVVVGVVVVVILGGGRAAPAPVAARRLRHWAVLRWRVHVLGAMREALRKSVGAMKYGRVRLCRVDRRSMALLSKDLIRWMLHSHTPVPECQESEGTKRRTALSASGTHDSGDGDDSSILVTQAAELQLFGDRGTFFELGGERVCMLWSRLGVPSFAPKSVLANPSSFVKSELAPT